jgi:RNA polymerase sigma-70 factor (ECF subfamily)
MFLAVIHYSITNNQEGSMPTTTNATSTPNATITEADIFACYDMVFRTMMKKCKNPAIAHDTAMNGIIKAVDNMDKYNGTSKVSTWVCTVAFRLWLDTIRNHSNSRTVYTGDAVFLENMGGSYEADFEIEDAEATVKQGVTLALQGLSEKHREVITLHYVDGLKYREIAERIGKPIGTVMSRLNQAKAKLKGNKALAELADMI